MKPRLDPLWLWRVIQVEPGATWARPTPAVPGGFDHGDCLGRSAADAVARLREREPRTAGMWLMAITCGRRPTKGNPNAGFFPPVDRSVQDLLPIVFGPQGSGKSTAVARIVSDQAGPAA